MATDALNTYKPAVERLGIDRQICIAHARKRAWNRLDWIDEWDRGKARIWRLLTELPFDCDLALPRLERAVRDGDATLRRLCVELSEKWRDVPWTNNAAERAIGGCKIKYKTVIGYKSEDWTLNGFGLGRRAWSGRDGLELSEPVAAQRRAIRWGSCVLRNPPQNDQPFLGQLRIRREARNERRPRSVPRRLRNGDFCEIVGFRPANSPFAVQQNRRETMYNGAKASLGG